MDLFGYEDGDGQLGLYGAFGYDLTFAFEPIDLKQDRDSEQRDLVLYLPDSVYVIDSDKRDAWHVQYEFNVENKSTVGLPRVGLDDKFQAFDSEKTEFIERDTPEGDFAKSVVRAKEEFKVGNLFETVLSQTFREKLTPENAPSAIFRRLRKRNPSPYGFLINLGDQEYLVGASPEMFVRCETIQENDNHPGAMRVETCPISGTVARGAGPYRPLPPTSCTQLRCGMRGLRYTLPPLWLVSGTLLMVTHATRCPSGCGGRSFPATR